MRDIRYNTSNAFHNVFFLNMVSEICHFPIFHGVSRHLDARSDTQHHQHTNVYNVQFPDLVTCVAALSRLTAIAYAHPGTTSGTRENPKRHKHTRTKIFGDNRVYMYGSSSLSSCTHRASS